MAYLMSRLSASKQSLCMMLIMLPMWINFLLRTYAWMSILENNGFINQFFRSIGLISFLQSHFGYSLDYILLINTQGAIVLGMVYNFLPFMVLPIYTVLIKLDRKLIEAAQDLGAPTHLVFRRVIFPLSIPGVISGITMVFVPSVSTFVISQMLGSGKNLLVGDLIDLQFIDSNESMYAKLKSGAANYDVIVPSDYMAAKMIAEGMLMPLNYDNIPNFQNIDEEYRNADYDPENAYTVPYMLCTTGIIYNTTMVNKAPTSWADLWDPSMRAIS